MGLRAGLARRLGASAPTPFDAREHRWVLEVARHGPAPLRRRATLADDEPLAIAIVIPSFRQGSGGHATIAHLVRGLEARGHRLSLWLHDPSGQHTGDVGALFTRFFGPVRATVHADLQAWTDTDVVLATGWQTVHRVLRLPAAAARAYLVQDHEPEFYATSAERLWAQETYRLGLHAITAGPWLAELMGSHYDAPATAFDLAVDHSVYGPREVPRRDDLVLFYCRAATPRRAVALGLMALEELQRRRPDVEVALYGEPRESVAGFPHANLGVLDAEALAGRYAQATVGMVLSLTNPSLIPFEMLACGLACVDLDTPAMAMTFGAHGPVVLAPPEPLHLCDAIEALLDDPHARARRSQAGAQWVAPRTWSAAASQVEHGLRTALGTAQGAGG